MASSVDLLALYANWSRSSADGRQDMMWQQTSFSKHFSITGV